MIPVFGTKKNVPFSSLDTINKELDCLENIGVISKVDYNDWVSPNVYMKKNKIRVCVDFHKELNEKKLSYVNGLSSLVLKFCEHLEDTIIAALRTGY